ncbi:MAG: hypothetical protein IAC13_02075 [Firmicutes bacterium]|uniref:Uncharacterized protein n=1 Tax=Candidatus Scybalomonas excrementavium TaxID=2840943 RepID=A0A9D9I093_9FIRM|nr:hypothetical protein [Candidatus Scybalomonas excrementavium]
MVNFQKWDMEFPVTSSFFIEDIQWKHEGLEIILEEETEEKNRVRLVFEDTVYSYRNTLESYKPSVWIEQEQDYYPFYYSHCTKELKDFCNDLEDLEDEIIHFLIIGIDHVIDVFTSDFPRMEKI